MVIEIAVEELNALIELATRAPKTMAEALVLKMIIHNANAQANARNSNPQDEKLEKSYAHEF